MIEHRKTRLTLNEQVDIQKRVLAPLVDLHGRLPAGMDMKEIVARANAVVEGVTEANMITIMDGFKVWFFADRPLLGQATPEWVEAVERLMRDFDERLSRLEQAKETGLQQKFGVAGRLPGGTLFDNGAP